MLPFFPAGLPGELLASRVSVYHILRGHTSSRVTYQEVFQAAPFPLTHWGPKHLDRLAAQIPGDPNTIVASIQQRSTVLPVFAQFLCERMTVLPGETGDGPWGNPPRRIVGESGATRLCVNCLIQDENDFGMPYIHREHQAPATRTCWRHGTRLIVRCPHCRCPFEVPSELILVPWRGCASCKKLLRESNVSQNELSSEEIALARFGKEVLDSTPVALHSTQLVGLYRSRAFELGFGRGSTLDRVRLLAAVEEHYGRTLLGEMDRAYQKGRTAGWFHMLARSQPTEAPVSRHLILAHFLFREPEAFVSQLQAAAMHPAPIERRSPRIKLSDPATNIAAEQCDASSAIEDDLNRLARLAKEDNLSLDDLWRTEYSTMKRLVTMRPNAIHLIEARLAMPDSSRKANTHAGLALVVDSKLDLDWAEAIKEAAERLYRMTGKPKRISINSLVKEAATRSGQWPTHRSFPRTRAACEEMTESQWHFYARRMMWMIERYSWRSPTRSALAAASKLEFYKAYDVLEYLNSIGCTPTSQPHPKTLEQFGILRNWSGPHPERHYQNTGRRHTRRALDQSAARAMNSNRAA